MSFHISRWRYWWAYFVVILFALYSFWLTDRAEDVASWTAGIAALILFIIMEIVIRRQRVITKNSVEIRSEKETKRIEFSKISHVSVVQSFLQHLLRYGTVVIKSPGEDIVLLNFAEAGKIARSIQKHLHTVHEKHEHHSRKPHVGP
jgi:uncharacterized membrane protein YdbT with pleckstrin-like domain